MTITHPRLNYRKVKRFCPECKKSFERIISGGTKADGMCDDCKRRKQLARVKAWRDRKKEEK